MLSLEFLVKSLSMIAFLVTYSLKLNGYWLCNNFKMKIFWVWLVSFDRLACIAHLDDFGKLKSPLFVDRKLFMACKYLNITNIDSKVIIILWY